MEDMDIVDQVVDVPDTPDRLTARHVDRKYVGNPDVDVMCAKKRERGFPVADEMNNCSNYIILSPSEKSCSSQNAPMFRRAQTEKFFGLGTTLSNGAEKMEKGKTVSSKSPSKSSHHGPISVLDLTEENGQSQQLKPTFSNRGPRNNAMADKKELKANFGNSPLPFIADSSNASRNGFVGRCNKTPSGPNTCVDRGKSIALSNDSQCPQKSEKQVSLPPVHSSAPRSRGQKRLVRNGCISPHNIATRAKQSAEQNSHQTNDIEQSHVGHSVSGDTISPICVDDIVAEERDSGRLKGKGVLIHPSSHGLNAGTIHTASRPLTNYEGAGVTSNAMRNSNQYSGGQGGWTTTHNDVARFVSRQNRNKIDRRDTGNGQSSKGVNSLSDHAAQATSLIIPEAGQLTGTHPKADTLTKRQRKRGSTSGNHNGSSCSSEIMFLGSSGESSSSSHGPVLSPEVVELLSEPRYTNRLSEDIKENDNNSSDARAQQVEADEILARELQEQLYHDDSFEGRGIDEHLTWELQHMEDLLHTSIDSHDIPHPMFLPREPSNRQPRSRTRQNPPHRRRAVPQVPVSNRMPQVRNRIARQSPRMSTRGRGPQFPLDMDLDMRLDILEALEDAVGDLSDMVVADDIFHAGRDFNEDDYEMLLALDEGNHQHTGASANQINSLPQSTIQTDNFAEVCVICLETPAKGELIRHLPCLHKFHKDCIDPWLHRKSSCPVCKSSIT